LKPLELSLPDTAATVEEGRAHEVRPSSLSTLTVYEIPGANASKTFYESSFSLGELRELLHACSDGAK
jgi:hypothetical protein